MIVINTCHIPEGGALPVDGTESAGLLNLDEYKYPVRAVGDIEYHFYASMAGRDLVVRGKTFLPIETECARCSDEISGHIAVDDFCLVIEKAVEKEVDITANVREELLLAFPMRFLCSSDCKGICPRCHVNLNHENCHCAAIPTTEEPPEHSPWDVLDAVQLPKKAAAKKKTKPSKGANTK